MPRHKRTRRPATRRTERVSIHSPYVGADIVGADVVRRFFWAFTILGVTALIAIAAILLVHGWW